LTKLKMTVAAAAATAVLASAGAAAAVTITVTPTLAPNAYGSPSYAGWIGNSIQAQLNGLSAYGDSSLPTYYEAQSNVTSRESIVTGFPSWKGVADPAPTGAFAGELGNRMHFGLLIDGQGTQFSISQLSLVMDSDDPYDALDYAYAAGGYNYDAGFWGILYGANGVLGGGDDTYITSGANTQLVDGLVGRGSGNSLAAYCPAAPADCSDPAVRQASLNDSAAYFDQFPVTRFTGTYTLANFGTQGDVSGSGVFTIGGIPEPSAWALAIVGFAGVGIGIRRRRAVA
jgi:hypothetical protein